MMDQTYLSYDEAQSIVGGEAITLTIVITYLAISILAILVWKLYTSGKGKISLPGGFLFEWAPEDTYLNPFLRLFKR